MYLKSADIPDGVTLEKPTPTTQDLLDAQLLLDAADQLRKGWCQDTFAQDADGRAFAGFMVRANLDTITHVCARGAILAQPNLDREGYDELRLTGHLAEQLSREGLVSAEVVAQNRGTFGRQAPLATVPTWNNALWRTQAEVVGLFERTAARLAAV